MNHRTLAPLLLLTLAACSRPQEPRPRDTDTTPPETGTPPITTETGHTGTTDTASTGVTGDTGPTTVEIDCATDVPAAPLSTQPIIGGRAYHDVIFDTTGLVLGSNGNGITWADYYGNSGLLVPGTGLVQGLGRLLDGDFVAASDSTDSLFRFTAAGGVANIIGNSGAYSVLVGHDGMIYTANYDAVERIDPVTGVRTELLAPNNFQPKSINWNRDYTKLFMATGFGNGNVYAIDIDPVTLDPVGQGYVFATNVGAGTYHDCLTVDYCDNVYVCDFSSQKMYRITPAGVVSTYIDFPNGMYAHGVEWGSGVGGFRVDAMYISQPYNGNAIAEVVVGIPGRDWDGTNWTPPGP